MPKISKKRVRDFLQRHFIMQIATVSPRNKPHASVMLYHMDRDFTFYMVTHRETYKSQNLLKKPYISLSVWEHGHMMVQADAKVSTVKDKKQALAITEKLADAATADEGFWPPLFRIGGDEYILFKIKPTWLRALDLTSTTITSKHTPFTEIKLS